MSHDVHVIKTTDGYELIGKVVKMRNDEVIRVMDPLEIRYRTNSSGGPAAVLVPYNTFGNDNFVDIFRNALVCVYRTTDEYAKTYDESVKSIEDQLKKKTDSGVIESIEKLKAVLGVVSSNSTFH